MLKVKKLWNKSLVKLQQTF